MNQPVFINRTLNMKKIKYIGLDMDHTLIRYKTQNFETLVYSLTVSELIAEKKYPESIRSLTFQFSDAIRGLVVDSKHGNILKLSRYGAIRASYHGTQPITFQEQKKIYRSTYVDLNDANYMAIDTSFSIAFCVLYGQLVDVRDANPHDFPSYSTMALDVLKAVDAVHANGHLKSYISEHLDDFVYKDPSLVPAIKEYIRHGKQFFILTNSEYYYTKLLLDYTISPFLDEKEHWSDLFQYIITLSNKPRFFYDKLPFLSIDIHLNTMTNTRGHMHPGVYQGGNARRFTEDLSLNGDEILYIGDHIYGDIVRLKKDCNWRTALVVEELGHEILAQKKAAPTERAIVDAMAIKARLEEAYVAIQTTAYGSTNPKQVDLQTQMNAIDQELKQLIEKQASFYNPKWDRIFRAGIEESYFANQVERFACIYMEKLSDLLAYSPLTYFRASKRLLPHDTTI